MRRAKQAHRFRSSSESLEIRTLLAADFGDAPADYAVTLADDGARHETPSTQGWALLGQEIDGDASLEQTGKSVSISSDGLTVAIGAPGHGSQSFQYNGTVRVYRLNVGTGAWSQLGPDIDGADLSFSGQSVSLSANGNVVAIGGPSIVSSEPGRTRIYQFDGVSSTWTQMGGDLVGDAAGEQSGSSVSLSDDGQTVAIGAPYNDVPSDNAGTTRIHQFDSGTQAWAQLGQSIPGDMSSQSGSSVSLSGNATTVAIGATYLGNGHTRIYRLLNSSWTQLGTDISGAAVSDEFGAAVSLSLDGNTLAVGAPGNDSAGNAAGHAAVYAYNGTAWQQRGDDIEGMGALDGAGLSVSLSDDGGTLAVGAPEADGAGPGNGYVRIFQYSSANSSWQQLAGPLNGEALSDESGYSVSLSANGTTVAIGAAGNDGNGNNAGHTRIYALSPAEDPLSLGSTRDTEADGMPSANADGDGADDDGIQFNPLQLVVGQTGSGVTVNVQNAVPAGARLDAWIDFNADQDWDDPGEQIFTSEVVNNGDTTLQFDIPVTALPGTTFTRFRLSTAGGLAPEGLASDGEVEDYQIDLLPRADFGDAAAGYPVLRVDNGAHHHSLLADPLRLGATRDVEPTGVPSIAADGDGSDEDGVAWPAVLHPGATHQVSVDLQGGSGSGNLDAWIDWNQNGTWDDPGEQILDTQSVAAGVSSVSIAVPGNAVSGYTYARFRLSTAGGLATTGPAADGEVEDYRIVINTPPTLDAIADLTIAEDAGTQTVDLTGITAGPGETQTLHVTAISSNPLVIPSPTVTYTSAEATGSITFTPLTDANGTALINVFVIDAGPDGDLSLTADNASFIRTFTVTVTPVNDPPTLAAINNQSEEENSGVHTLSLTGITPGPGGEAESIRITATSGDGSLITDPQVTYNTGEDTATLSWSSELHQIGTATITVTVEDAGPDDDFASSGDNLTFVRTFDITVTPRPYDYGDAGASYPVTRVQNGARHDTPAAGPQLWRQRGGDIDGEAVGDYSGNSVSLSADGNTVAIGAIYGHVGGAGHTRIYRWNAGTATWVQLGVDIDGEAANDYSGSSVSLSADGNTVAIGAFGNGGLNGQVNQGGHTRIYRWNVGTETWVQLGNDIDGEAWGDFSGWSVSLSADGNTVAIGAHQNDGLNGQVNQGGHTRIYRWNAGTAAWDQLGSAIDGEAAGDHSGYSVSLSADGNTVAIGAIYGHVGGAGHTRIYRWNAGTATWVQLGVDIDGEATGDYSGSSVSLSADGNTVAIGAHRNDGVYGQEAGHTRIYRWNVGTTAWDQLGGDIDGEAGVDRSGYSVSLSSDGNTVAIGAPKNEGVDGGGAHHGGDDDLGHTRIYRYNGWAWDQLGVDINGEAAGDHSGYSVSLSSDGNTVAIGAHYNDGVNGQDSGHTRIYRLIDNPLRLGAIRDVEPTGVPSIAADGDGDDEDGLSWPAVLVAGDTYQIPVDLQGGSGSGNLDAWIDWNQNGHWNDPGEQIVDTQSVTAGVTTVSLTVPGDAASGDTYARFRLSTAGGLGPTGLAADGEVEDYRVTINAAPTLDAITDLTIAEDAGLQNIDLTGITAGPGETQTLHVTAISSNPLVIPSPTVTYTSAEATGSITFTPLTDASGSATVTVTVTDAGPDGDLSLTADNASFSRTFNVTVTPVNDLPTLDAIADLAVFPGATDIAVSLSGISASGSETQPLRVTASSSNTALVLIPSVIYSPNGATGTLEVTTVSGVVGQAVITVTVEDGGLDDDLSTDGDNATVSRTFEVTVSLSTPEWETQGITSTIDPRQPIRWNPVPGATGYQVWYTNASTGVSPFLTATTDQTEFVPTDGLPIGRFNIWVRAQQDHLNSSWSPGIRLRVWPWTTLQTPDFQQTDLRPTMTWDALNGAVSYRIVYSNLTTGGSRLVDSTVSGTSFTPTEDLSLGYYRAWVAGLDFSGTQTQWSYPVQFTIGPQPISPVLPVFTRRPVLEWTSVPGTATYELYISTQGGNVLTPSGITGTSWTPSSDLATGWLNWWVIGLTDTGARGRWSERASSNTQGRTSVIAPAGSGHSGTPLYQWQAVQDAATYVLIVERVSDRQVLIRENTLTTTTYTPSAALAADTYRVWVQAISTTGQPGWWSRPVEFTVASVTRTKGTADLQPLEPAVTVPDLLNLLADERVSGRTAETASSEVNPQQPTSHPAERRFRQQVVTGTRAARASAAVDNGRSATDGFANDGPASRTARLPHTAVASEFQQDVHTRDQLMAGLSATKTRPDSFLDVSL